jgi:replicative DNA helicase
MSSQTHSLQTEMIVLSGIVQHDGVLEDIAFLQNGHFYSPLNALIYEGIRAYEATGGTVFDIFSLAAAFNTLIADPKKGLSYRKKFDLLEKKGLDAYLSEIYSIPSIKLNIVRHATILQEYAIRRNLIKVGNGFASDASSALPVADLIDNAAAQLAQVSATHQRKNIEFAPALVDSHVEAMEGRLAGKERVLATGLKDLDEVLNGGFRGGELIIVGARPGMGKTAFCIGVDLAVAECPDEDGKLRSGVLHFTMEMQNINNTDRIISTLGSIDSRKIKNGLLTERDFDGLTFAYSKFSTYPFGMYDKSGCKLHEIISQARKAKKEFESKGQRLDLISIDYMQLMGSDNVRAQRNAQIEEISRGLKGLAKDLNVPVIALSQFNRQADGEKRPSIANLRDSGSLEQDADIILFPYREEQDNPDTEMTGYADLYVSKNRNGPLAHIGLRYEAEFTRFSDWAGVVPKSEPAEKSKSRR